ncbi:unnamed protein product, partial [Hapterophycus canaliculatus]
GIANEKVCCLDTCGDCGGTGCRSRDGGPQNCCVQRILEADNDCDDDQMVRVLL